MSEGLRQYRHIVCVRTEVSSGATSTQRNCSKCPGGTVADTYFDWCVCCTFNDGLRYLNGGTRPLQTKGTYSSAESKPSGRGRVSRRTPILATRRRNLLMLCATPCGHGITNRLTAIHEQFFLRLRKSVVFRRSIVIDVWTTRKIGKVRATCHAASGNDARKLIKQGINVKV